LEKVGSFKLNPAQPNTYWHSNNSYEYNQYEIEITSAPDSAHIILNDKYIGDTPFVHKFTGVLDKGDRLHFRIVPLDEKREPQACELKIKDELPRKIFFELNNKGKA